MIEELRAAGYRTKQRQAGDRITGGVPFGRGMLFALLGNPIYAGRIHHKGELHDGEHQAIVDPECWEAVQRQIELNRVERSTAGNQRSPSLLAGLLIDPLGRCMSPSHATKGPRRYRYYITHAAEIREGDPAAHRLPAHEIEGAVIEHLRAWLT